MKDNPYSAPTAPVAGYGIYLAAGGATPEEIERLAKELDPFSPIGVAASAIGLAFSALGGYVCARVAGVPELRWAAIVGAISAISGFALSTEAYSLGTNIVLSALGFAMVMLGGYIGARRNARTP